MKVVVHFDEIFLKGKNQGFFVKKLAENIRRLFVGAVVRRVEGGLILENIKPEFMDRLANTPGIAKFAPIIECASSINSIKKAIAQIEIPKNSQTFRITASRSYKKFEKNSEQINRELGAFFAGHSGLKVDLGNPDLNIKIDVAKNRALIYWREFDGAGGLPVGTAGKVLCLISGGIDSPVATYQMQKRGAEIVMIHFQNETSVTDEVSQKILDIAKTLSHYQQSINVVIVPFAEFQRKIVMKVPADYRMIISRRLMMKIAEQYAKKNKILALVTGDSLGQVASQTLENLSAIYGSTTMLTLSPLMGTNKNEIIKVAEKIKTLEISKRPYEDCCSLFVSKHPKTKANMREVKKIEESMGDLELDRSEFISYHISIY
jgi:thiamine biosynthesis protein ThiI